MGTVPERSSTKTLVRNLEQVSGQPLIMFRNVKRTDPFTFKVMISLAVLLAVSSRLVLVCFTC